MMNDKALWMALRRSFIQLAEEASTPSEKRAYLRVVSVIEETFGLGKVRIVPDERSPISRDDSVA